MKIKYSANDEVSIEGSRVEYNQLRNKINHFVSSSNSSLLIKVEVDFNPERFEDHADSLIFSKCVSNSIEIIKRELIISGTPDFLLNIADNLPSDIEILPYHVHYDSISFPQFLNEESFDVVFEVIS